MKRKERGGERERERERERVGAGLEKKMVSEEEGYTEILRK